MSFGVFQGANGPTSGGSAPYKFTPRVGSQVGYLRIADGAVANQSRKAHLGFDRDQPKLIGWADRRALLSTSRWLYCNIPALTNALDQQAQITAGNLQVQFDGDDAAWGAQAEEWLATHDAVCDIRGAPFNMGLLDQFIVSHAQRDGDFFIHLTQGDGGYPLVQAIPAHRIRGDFYNAPKAADDGPYSDAFADYQVRDGVVLNEIGRALAYMVWEDVTYSWRYIPAQDMVPCMLPKWADQLRGYPAVSPAIIHWQDREEWMKFELQAMKLASSVSLVENNETGTAPPDASELVAASNDPMTGELRPALYGQQMLGGEVRYFRAGSGGKLEALISDRPTQNQRDFTREIARDALAAMGWSIDFSLDPSKLGGAPHRTMVDTINRSVRMLRQNLLFPARKRIDGWRIAKAIKLGFLPPNDHWHRWKYQGASDITADRKYEFDVAEGELAKGLTSPQIECAKRGGDWEKVMDDAIAYESRLQAACAKAGVDPDRVRQTAKQTTQTFMDPNAGANDSADETNDNEGGADVQD